mgnify:CR=1 FL=1
MQGLASTLLGFVMQIHVFHWLASTHAQHIVLGELYEGIHELADEFMEVYMGKYGKDIGNNSASMVIYNNEDVNEYIKMFEAYLNSFNDVFNDTDLLNI